MEKRSLGKSGLRSTPIGLGLAALGRPGYINVGHAQDLGRNYDVKAMEKNAHAVLDAAWETGIRYFDAARSYGRAERFLSSWLAARSINPGDVTVSSKWGYTYTAGWQVQAEFHEVKDHSLEVLQRQLSESLKLLGSYLDLYQIHSATLDSHVLDNDDVLNKLARLRASGLRIGLSLSGSAQSDTLRKAMKIRYDGELLFSSVQATWNLLSQEAGETLREASDAGLGIIIKEALANGRLTPRNQEPPFTSKRKLLDAVAETEKTTVDAIALAVVLDQPWVDVVLSGAATVQHLHANIASLDVELGDKSDQILHNLRESPAQYWATRSKLIWN